MLILILGVAVIAMVTFIVLYCKTKPYESYELTPHTLFGALAWVFAIIASIILIVICCLAPVVATESTIDKKIAMYQEENANIEQDIDRIVQEYLRHEHDTFDDLKTEESSITLVTLFPELKSDTLVQQQLEIYVSNNAKIKELKEEKIDIAKQRWILYFGR